MRRRQEQRIADDDARATRGERTKRELGPRAALVTPAPTLTTRATVLFPPRRRPRSPTHSPTLAVPPRPLLRYERRTSTGAGSLTCSGWSLASLPARRTSARADCWPVLAGSISVGLSRRVLRPSLRLLRLARSFERCRTLAEPPEVTIRPAGSYAGFGFSAFRLYIRTVQSSCQYGVRSARAHVGRGRAHRRRVVAMTAGADLARRRSRGAHGCAVALPLPRNSHAHRRQALGQAVRRPSGRAAVPQYVSCALPR